MGFLSSLTGKQKTNVPATGFYSQPGAYQSLYNTILGNANSGIGSIGADAFTPLGITGDEQTAMNNIRQGYAPTESSLRSDISMFMNPFDDYVIGDVNRQAQGENSILKQALNASGQLNSNRSILGANDIEQTRLGTIGKLRQGAYNDALGNVLNNLIPQRMADDQNLMGLGAFERNLDSQTKQAPMNALAAQQGILAGIPTSFGNFGNQQYTIKSGGGLGGLMGGLGQLGGLASGLGGLAGAAGLGGLGGGLGSIGSALAMFSDKRLKENIEYVRHENGVPVYRFNYIGEPETYIGVMAQDVAQSHPEAVTMVDGYMTVDYGKLGVEFRRDE